MKPAKFSFKEVDSKKPNLLVKLAPTSDSGEYGEAIIQFYGLPESRDVEITTKDGRTVKVTRYEMLAKPIEGTYIDLINKEEIVKKDPKTGKVIGKDNIPKVYDADELLKEMEKRGNEYVIIRLSAGNYEFLRKNYNNGKIAKGDIIKLEYNVLSNGGVSIKRILKAEVSQDDENIDSESHQ